VGRRGALLLARMAARGTVRPRRLGGDRAGGVRFGRLLANPAASLERLPAGWGGPTAAAAAGRAHVLAVRDTTELRLRTTPERRRGLGEVGEGGRARGLLPHAMLAPDAESGACLGLVGGEVRTRRGRVDTPRQRRPLAGRGSRRRPATAERAGDVPAGAGTVTAVADREGDLHAGWARLPGPGSRLPARAMQDRPPAGGGELLAAGRGFPAAAGGTVEPPATGPGRCHRAEPVPRPGPVAPARPGRTVGRDPPASVALTLVEVEGADPPAGVEPVHRRLPTTRAVAGAAAARRVAGRYEARWTIGRLSRIPKAQGLDVGAGQPGDAARLPKLAATAARAAAAASRLVRARDGRGGEPAAVASDPADPAALQALGPRPEGGTAARRNPHPSRSSARAAWLAARPGGRDGHASSRPPGPITLERGLDRSRAIAAGWRLRDVCMP
jgi:hypothetical protein